MNLGTITNSLSWYKISLFSAYYQCEYRTSQGTEKNLMEVFRAVTEAKSYRYERLIRIWLMESSLRCSETRNSRTSPASSKNGASIGRIHQFRKKLSPILLLVALSSRRGIWETKARIHHFGKKALPSIFPWMCGPR